VVCCGHVKLFGCRSLVKAWWRSHKGHGIGQGLCWFSCVFDAIDEQRNEIRLRARKAYFPSSSSCAHRHFHRHTYLEFFRQILKRGQWDYHILRLRELGGEAWYSSPLTPTIVGGRSVLRLWRDDFASKAQKQVRGRCGIPSHSITLMHLVRQQAPSTPCMHVRLHALSKSMLWICTKNEERKVFRWFHAKKHL
jgi:hypothetical protein